MQYTNVSWYEIFNVYCDFYNIYYCILKIIQFISLNICESFVTSILAIHCIWNDWIIGECSATCGTGTRINNRTKLVEEEHGGTCTGKYTETEECKIKECPGKVIYQMGRHDYTLI